MKHIKQILAATCMALLVMVSCKKKEYSLDRVPEKSEINMEVKQDLTVDAGGNTVYLINHTNEIEPIWDYGTGKSMRRVDTVRYAFKGTYKIARSAVTGGGLVYLDTVTINVTADNLNYVNDPFWTLLSGGPGQEKSWALDLDANGVSKVFTSPLYFGGDELGWGLECTKPNGNCWTWFPNWSDNKWICPAGDYGTMTFSLKGGPFVNVDQKVIAASGVFNGTYYLDKDAKTLTFNGVKPLNIGRGDLNFSKGVLLKLTEGSMQIGFKHVTKTEFEIYNYIAK
jgi:hypothetical protein